ncbi:GNAT family protein [Neofusicoccum parvum]|uniref:GNAT family protein n=1 Tax=Neofusicoccum parvum TaxID=310453 RepID=A0ACB5RZL6_9PEZI|nr:GNAT family protein [Neofusicoccum parvum]
MPFKVQPTVLADIPILVDIYLAAFRTNAFGGAVFPDTPAVRQWWTAALSHELSHQKGAAFYNLVEYAAGTDTPTFSENDEQRQTGGPTIVAFAKWLRPMEGVDPQDAVEIPTDLPPECDGELFARYFPELSRRHKMCMGTRAHWYLELLATHPSHQRRGAASQLVNHVLVDNSANTRFDAYLEASPEGLSTYRRLGFERRDGFVVDIKGQPYETLMMVRPGKVEGAAVEGAAVEGA